MAEQIGEDRQAEDPLTGEALKRAFAQQTDALLKLGLACDTPASDLLGVHAHRRAIEDGDLHRAAEVAKLLGWDRKE